MDKVHPSISSNMDLNRAYCAHQSSPSPTYRERKSSPPEANQDHSITCDKETQTGLEKTQAPRQKMLKRSFSDTSMVLQRKRKLKDQINEFNVYKTSQNCKTESEGSGKNSQVSFQRTPIEKVNAGHATRFSREGTGKKRRLVRSASYNWETSKAHRAYDYEGTLQSPPSVKMLLQKFESTSSSPGSDKSLEESSPLSISPYETRHTKSIPSFSTLREEETIESTSEINGLNPSYSNSVQSEPKACNGIYRATLVRCYSEPRWYSEPNPLRKTRKSIREIPPIVKQLRIQFETSSPPLRDSLDEESHQLATRKQSIQIDSVHDDSTKTLEDCEEEVDSSQNECDATLQEKEDLTSNSKEDLEANPNVRGNHNAKTVDSIENRCTLSTPQGVNFTSSTNEIAKSAPNCKEDMEANPNLRGNHYAKTVDSTENRFTLSTPHGVDFTQGVDFTSPTNDIANSERNNWELEIIRDPGTPSVRFLAKQFEEVASASAFKSSTKKFNNQRKICPHGEIDFRSMCAECMETAIKTNDYIMTSTPSPQQNFNKQDSIHSTSNIQEYTGSIGNLVDKFVAADEVKFEESKLSVPKIKQAVARRGSDVLSLIEKFSNANKRRLSSSSNFDENETEGTSSPSKKSKDTSCTSAKNLRPSVFMNDEMSSSTNRNVGDISQNCKNSQTSELQLERRNSDIALLINKFTNLTERRSTSSSSTSFSGNDSTDCSPNTKVSFTTPTESNKNLQGKVRHLNTDELKFFHGEESSPQPFIRSQSLRLQRTESLKPDEPFVRSQSLRDRKKGFTPNSKHLKLQRSPSCPTYNNHASSTAKNIPKFCRALHPDEMRFFSGDIKAYSLKGWSESKELGNTREEMKEEKCDLTCDSDNSSEYNNSDLDISILRDCDVNDVTFYESNIYDFGNPALNISFCEDRLNQEYEKLDPFLQSKDLFMMEELKVPDTKPSGNATFVFETMSSNDSNKPQSSELSSGTITYYENQLSESPHGYKSTSVTNMHNCKFFTSADEDYCREVPILKFSASTPLNSLEYDINSHLSDKVNTYFDLSDLSSETLDAKSNDYLDIESTGNEAENYQQIVSKYFNSKDFGPKSGMESRCHQNKNMENEHLGVDRLTLPNSGFDENRRLSDVALLIEKFNNLKIMNSPNSTQQQGMSWTSPSLRIDHSAAINESKSRLQENSHSSFYNNFHCLSNDSLMTRDKNAMMNNSDACNGNWRVGRRHSDVALLIEKFTNMNLKKDVSSSWDDTGKESNRRDSDVAASLIEKPSNLTHSNSNYRVRRRHSDVALLIEKFTNLTSKRDVSMSLDESGKDIKSAKNIPNKLNTLDTTSVPEVQVSTKCTSVVDTFNKAYRELHPDEVCYFSKNFAYSKPKVNPQNKDDCKLDRISFNESDSSSSSQSDWEVDFKISFKTLQPEWDYSLKKNIQMGDETIENDCTLDQSMLGLELSPISSSRDYDVDNLLNQEDEHLSLEQDVNYLFERLVAACQRYDTQSTNSISSGQFSFCDLESETTETSL